jgi:hypothetical protein
MCVSLLGLGGLAGGGGVTVWNLGYVVVVVVVIVLYLFSFSFLFLFVRYTQQHDCCSTPYRSADMVPRCNS